MYIEKLSYEVLISLHKRIFGNKDTDAVYSMSRVDGVTILRITLPDGYEEEFRYADFEPPKGYHPTMYWESKNFFEEMLKHFGDGYIRDYFRFKTGA